MAEPPNDRLTAQGRLTAYYSEPEMAQYSRLEIQVIRQLAEDEVIGSIEVTNEGRHYGAPQLALLRRVRRLYYDLGVNLEGIEIIVRLIARIERLQHELARYQRMTAGPASAQSATNKASQADQQQNTEEHPPSNTHP